jgi:O-antigen/teichoic acid export membrane protein
LKLTHGYNSIVKNSAYLYASLLINQFTRLIYIIVLARYLGPDIYGLFSYGQVWYVAFIPLCMLGLGPLLVRAVSRDKKEGQEFANCVTSIQICSISITAVICGVTGWLTSDSSELAILLVIFSFALIGRAVSLWGDQMFNAYEKTKLTLNQERIFRTGEVLLGIGTAIIMKDVIWLAMLHASIWIFQAIRAVYLVQTHLQIIKPVWDWPINKKLLFEGAPIGISLVLDGLMIQGAIIIYKMNGATNNSLGNMAIVIQAFIMLASIFIAINKAILPVISRSVDRGDDKDQLYLSFMIRIAFVLGALIGLMGLALGADIVQMVFGSQYQEAMEHLGMMLWLLIPYIIKQAINSTLLAHGKFGKILQLNLIGFICMLLSVQYFYEQLGFTSAILGIIFGCSAESLIGIIYLTYLKLINNAIDIVKLILIALSGLYLYSEILAEQKFVAFIISSIAILIAVFLLDIVKKQEKKAIKKILTSLKSRFI